MKASDKSFQVNDNSLRERLRSGDVGAIIDAYRLYGSQLYRSIFNLVGNNRYATEEIVQETFMAALKGAKTFRGDSSVRTWIYAIAHKKMADYYRKAKRIGEYQRIELPTNQISDEPESGISQTEALENREIVELALRGLPVHYREVLVLKYVEDKSVLEISQIIGRSAKSVEALITRARKELRDGITAQSEGKREQKATNNIEEE